MCAGSAGAPMLHEDRPMRIILTALALTVLAPAAVAQTNPGQNPGAYFQNMKPEDAARLNQAVQSDPRAREALNQVEQKLNDANHPAGKMLEKTR
jgi:hypothetical protein